ncbi:hypothetical protein HDU97_005387 [Phlyctochytrium planicorne]|nr:hypothetical protein HDU97_005387 [Phlyctochytrium planicorne]
MATSASSDATLPNEVVVFEDVSQNGESDGDAYDLDDYYLDGGDEEDEDTSVNGGGHPSLRRMTSRPTLQRQQQQQQQQQQLLQKQRPTSFLPSQLQQPSPPSSASSPKQQPSFASASSGQQQQPQPKMVQDVVQSLLKELDESLLITSAKLQKPVTSNPSPSTSASVPNFSNNNNGNSRNVVAAPINTNTSNFTPQLQASGSIRRPSVASSSSSLSLSNMDALQQQLHQPSREDEEAKLAYSLDRLIAPPRCQLHGTLSKLSISAPATAAPSSRTSWKRRLFLLSDSSLFLFKSHPNPSPFDTPLTFLRLYRSSIVTEIGDVFGRNGIIKGLEVLRSVGWSGPAGEGVPVPAGNQRWLFAVRSESEGAFGTMGIQGEEGGERVWILGATDEQEMATWTSHIRSLISSLPTSPTPPRVHTSKISHQGLATPPPTPLQNQAGPPSPASPNMEVEMNYGVRTSSAVASHTHGQQQQQAGMMLGMGAQQGMMMGMGGQTGMVDPNEVAMLQYKLEQQQQMQQRMLVEQELRRQIALQQIMIQQQYQAYASAMAQQQQQQQVPSVAAQQPGMSYHHPTSHTTTALPISVTPSQVVSPQAIAAIEYAQRAQQQPPEPEPESPVAPPVPAKSKFDWLNGTSTAAPYGPPPLPPASVVGSVVGSAAGSVVGSVASSTTVTPSTPTASSNPFKRLFSMKAKEEVEEDDDPFKSSSSSVSAPPSTVSAPGANEKKRRDEEKKVKNQARLEASLAIQMEDAKIAPKQVSTGGSDAGSLHSGGKREKGFVLGAEGKKEDLVAAAEEGGKREKKKSIKKRNPRAYQDLDMDFIM